MGFPSPAALCTGLPCGGLEQDSIDSPIAERHYTLVGPDGAHSSVVVQLCIPQPDGPAWQCPYQIQGLGNTYTRVCIAADSMQALQLVMIMIGAELVSSLGTAATIWDSPWSKSLTEEWRAAGNRCGNARHRE